MPPRVSARVAPSGQAFCCTLTDDAGNPLNLATLTTGDEVQSASLARAPGGGTFTLSLNGQATAPIPAIPSAPSTYFRWNATLAAPGAVDLAANIYYDGLGSATATYEILDNGAVIGTVVRNLQGPSGNPATFTGGQLNPAGGQVLWTPLGRFTFATTSASVRLSAPPPSPSDPALGTSYTTNRITADCLRVAPVGGAAVVVNSATPPGVQVVEAPGAAWYREARNNQVANTSALPAIGRGQGAGIRYLADPVAVRAALEALGNVGAGNVTVTGNGDPRTPLVITFVGARGNAAQSLLTASDPALTVARLFAGGTLPTFKVNGVAVVTGLPSLRTPFWGEGKFRSNGRARTSGPYLPLAYFPLVQGLKAPIYESIQCHQNTAVGSWTMVKDAASAFSTPARFYDLARTAVGIGPTATWKNAPMKVGTYRVAATWPAAPGLSSAVVYTITNRAGATLATATVDQTVAPSGFSDRGVSWQVLGTVTLSGGLTDDLYVTQANGTSARMIADTIRIERTSADDSVQVKAGDVVTYTAGAGWCSTVPPTGSTVALQAPAATNATVDNLVGVPIYPPLPTRRTMDVGWNVNEFRYYSGVVMYANFAVGIEQLDGLEYDSDGYPTKLPTEVVTGKTALLSQDSYEADGKRWPSIPPGDYVLEWDGPDQFSMSGTPTDEFLTGGLDNRRYYRLDRDTLGWGAPSLRVDMRSAAANGDGTWSFSSKNLRVYQILPGVDLNSPPRWRPEHVARITGVRNLRFLDPLGVIDGNAATWEDFNRPETNLTRSFQARVRFVEMARFEPYAGPEIWNPMDGQVWRITTANPHGLTSGTRIDFESSVVGSVTYSNGLKSAVAGMYGPVRVLSPTELLFQFGKAKEDNGGVLCTSTTVLTAPIGRLRAKLGNSMLFSDLVDMCNVGGADFHLNVPPSATDDAITQMGRFLAANLKPGLKVRVAYVNEYWNFTHKVYDWVFRQGYGTLNPVDGRRIASRQDPVPYLCERSIKCWELVGAELTALGRGADLIRVMEGQFASPGGTTQPIAKYLRDRRVGGGVVEQAGDVPEPKAFDEYGIAPYFQNHVGFTAELASEPWFNPILDILTPDQLLDFHEFYSVHGRWAEDARAHRVVLDNNGHTATKLITYEGGPERMIPPGPNARIGQRTHAVHRHPRYFGVVMNTLRQYEIGGVSLFNFFLMGLADQKPDFQMWSAYTGTAQAPYVPGDAAQDAIQIEQFDRTDLIKSVTGGAVKAWAALPGPGTDTDPGPPVDVSPWIRVADLKPAPGIEVTTLTMTNGPDQDSARYDPTLGRFLTDQGDVVTPKYWKPVTPPPAE